MESEAINIDKYLGCDEDKKFDFLFDNYSILKPIIKDYREDLISDVVDIFELLTEWKKKNTETVD